MPILRCRHAPGQLDRSRRSPSRCLCDVERLETALRRPRRCRAGAAGSRPGCPARDAARSGRGPRPARHGRRSATAHTRFGAMRNSCPLGSVAGQPHRADPQHRPDDAAHQPRAFCGCSTPLRACGCRSTLISRVAGSSSMSTRQSSTPVNGNRERPRGRARWTSMSQTDRRRRRSPS